MCGRFQVDRDNKELDKLLKALPPNSPQVKTGEVFPGNTVLTLTFNNKAVACEAMAWGFPRWDKKGLVFNARAESALQKPMFATSLKKRPAVVPTSGFFEWRNAPDKKHKEKFLFRSGEPVLYLAGFWNSFPEEELARHFTILTTQANPSMIPYHHRMPVTIHAHEIEAWLNGHLLSDALTREPLLLQASPVA